MVLALTSAAANTQTHCHVYGDGVISGPDKDYSGFLTGGGARIMLAPSMGVHAGFRYTRHYELAFTVGPIFRLWAQ